MASCVKCGAALIALARFCATCGSPVTRGSVAPPAAPPKTDAASVPDPFARTMLGGDRSAAVVAVASPVVSPMAASWMANQAPTGQTPPPSAPPPAVAAAQPYPSPPAGPTQYAAPLPQQSHNIAPGTMVLVYWADGQRYPGTVLQVSAHHVFVAFPNGVQQWIDARYITVGS